uniref:Protein phosphatase 1, regulatory subunit 15B n=1 Tax=Takifugu rubripes TaxID=31033 RepID=A0A3B5KUL5_TAKRU
MTFFMFRFEVHVSITDETGQHIQHMSAAANPSDSFLFSSLFDGDGSMMVGSSGHISNFCSDMGDPFTRKSTAEALLSSLRAEELCCGLVDEFVSRTSGKEDNMFGPQNGWKMGFSGDWNIFSCSGDPSCKSTPEEDQVPVPSGRDGLNILVSRSDSEISWGSSDGSTLSEDAEQLLEFFTSSDPYDPMCFTACSSTSRQHQQATTSLPSSSTTDTRIPSSSEEEEEWLWNSLKAHHDPYHPLNFQACLRTASVESPPWKDQKTKKSITSKPSLQERPSKHYHPEITVVPWTRPGKSEKTNNQSGSTQKKVRFSPVIHVHVMRSWLFARQASRKGNWEEMARDRDRFQRRIKEAEASIGSCLNPAHRRKIRANLDDAVEKQ